jgi:non-ribosomal peptide synthetase component F
MALTVMPRRSSQVSQDLLRNIVALQNAVLEMTRELNERREELLSHLLDGAEVEPGLHVALVLERTKGDKRVQQLKVR